MNSSTPMHTLQHPISGLLPAFLYEDLTPGWAKNDAWVRDNVYSVLSIWGMSVAYKRRADTEDDRLKAYELEQVREKEKERNLAHSTVSLWLSETSSC